ncbi:hypothetical protein A3740_06680 [Oleiphilus sp. HI0068]|nr:hypothetical protein A3729_09380 [Oleiphilus sp. HI0043]KZY53155.1 hypothetical protein A3735_05830 [Oleiphilus sp. HI0061]KZY76395.1 hypothetical protein A3741_10910 [Oleiphilus sp. HI0069]KZY80208.1 hypothetical protein A3740_06680 [Oleiphilus sp. HI0068]KZY88637.1 hypothetical protein A3743_11125 [Oleiphilus sp. HI0072]KZZ35626.1 hypothetical protein A3757_00315 [Oleiphilus sp. HI0117]KZZ42489.1 hypothetical protein A3755_00470 [Oleiphilus sp. HI0085]KZZ65330.1 hypothetical protein A37
MARPDTPPPTTHECPLCLSKETRAIHRDSHSKVDREYLNCAHCDLIFVPKQFHISPGYEKSIYDLHENNPEDKGYRRFLEKLSMPLISQLEPFANGLDFGCGPGPTLSIMMREKGFNVEEYDPFYMPDKSPLSGRYDFITSTEVVEHLSKPKEVFELLFKMLKKKGVLGIMTKQPPKQGIVNWQYTKDPTHISFYSVKTFQYIAALFDCQLEVISYDTVLLIKR